MLLSPIAAAGFVAMSVLGAAARNPYVPISLALLGGQLAMMSQKLHRLSTLPGAIAPTEHGRVRRLAFAAAAMAIVYVLAGVAVFVSR